MQLLTNPLQLKGFLALVCVTFSVIPTFLGQTHLIQKSGSAWPWFLTGFLMALGGTTLRPEVRRPFQFPEKDPTQWRRAWCFLPSILLASLSFYSVYFQVWGNRIPLILWLISISILLVTYWWPVKNAISPADAERPDSSIGPFNTRTLEILGFCVVLLIAFLFRFVELERFPVMIHNDEGNCGLMGQQIINEWNQGA